MSEGIVEDGPYERGGEIPQGDVDLLLFTTDDRHNDLDRDENEHDLDENVVPYRKLARLDTEVLTESKRNETSGEPEIPEPEDQPAPVLLVHANPAQAGDHVVRQAEDCGGERTEDHAHHMDRAQPSPGQPGDGAEKAEIVELDREDHAD